MPSTDLNALPDDLPLGKTAWARVVFSFSALGLERGCLIKISHEPAYAGTPWAPALPERYTVRPHATRCGLTYGAAPVRSYASFSTYAEARAHAEAYVARARARILRDA
jgi:hypothetical protein